MKDVEVRDKIPDGPAVLTEREVEVFQCFADGLTVKDIGKKLLMSPRTVDAHRAKVMKKTGAKKVIQVCIALYKKGIIR